MTSVEPYTPEPAAVRYRLFDDDLNMLYDRFETDPAEARQHITEFMIRAGHAELNYAIDDGRGWKTRHSGKVCAMPGYSAQWHDSHEFLKYMLTPANPAVDPTPEDGGMSEVTQRIADILRDALEGRPVITATTDIPSAIPSGWVGPISWELAEAVVSGLGLREEEDADFTGGATVRYVTERRPVT